MQTVVDDRTFESDIPLTAEEQAATTAYFEAKGVEITFEGDKKNEEGKPAEETVVDPPAKDAPVVADKPVDAAAPIEEPDLDPEARAEWQSANTDREKLGSYAKKNRKIRELNETVAERDRRLATQDTELAELKGRLAERPAAPVSNPLEPAKPAVEVRPVEPPKAREFDKAAPEAPEFNNYLDEPDPQAAFSAAMIKYVDDKSDWKLEKRDFEVQERQRVDQETNQQNSEKQQVTSRYASAKQAHSDYEQRTQVVEWNGMLTGILQRVLDDGFELAYHLAAPEHAETLKSISEYTHSDLMKDNPVAASKAFDRAIQDLAVFRYELKQKKAAAPTTEQAAPQIPAVPAAPPVAAPTNGVPPVVVQPPVSNGQPRREEVAAPAHIKGHAATPAIRLEDIPQDDYDARRSARRQLGQF